MAKPQTPIADDGYLTGNLLVAMPQMADLRFARSVIYICAHTADGAMGLVINREIETITFPGLLKQLGIEVFLLELLQALHDLRVRAVEHNNTFNSETGRSQLMQVLLIDIP